MLRGWIIRLKLTRVRREAEQMVEWDDTPALLIVGFFDIIVLVSLYHMVVSVKK
jgi:hypothetical protein